MKDKKGMDKDTNRKPRDNKVRCLSQIQENSLQVPFGVGNNR